MNRPSDRETINILGAGLCGSLLAILLARRGFPVTVRELRADPRTTEQAAGRSINLALSARGIRALKHAGIFDKVEPLLLPMRGRLVHEADGDTHQLPYGQRDDEVIYSVSRAHLNCILIDIAEEKFGVAIEFEHAVTRYDNAQHVVHLRHADKDYELPAKTLLVADGAGSQIRRAYAKDSLIGPSESLLPHGYKELLIPPHADGSFKLDPEALHIWPRSDFMLISLPNPGGDFTLTLFMPNEGENSFAALQESNVDPFFRRHFTDVTPLIAELEASWQENPVGILGTVRCQHWHDEDRFLLIGDAAHAIVPFHGQGMNLAFEDCVLFDELLGEQVTPDWPELFAVFEEQQRPNANAIADMALENYVEMRDTVREPKFALRKELAFELERRLPERFIPRYSMVMFHDEIPYAAAQQRGEVQADLLQHLTKDADSLADINIDAAEQLVRKRLDSL